MRSEFIIAVLLFFPVLVLQTTVVTLISVNGVAPDLILILLVYFSIRNGQIYGTVLGFVYGFLFDLITGSLLGSAMLSKTMSGFIAGYFSNENKREQYLKSYTFPLIILLCSIVDSIVYSFFSTVELTRNVFLLFFQQGMMPAFYTAVLSIVITFFIPKRHLT
jgi:rod shape-determining protein MreD